MTTGEAAMAGAVQHGGHDYRLVALIRSYRDAGVWSMRYIGMLAVPDDPGRIRQILINLVGSAIKFTERGEILVTAKLESEGDEMAGVHFTVKDSWVAIAVEASEGLRDGSMARKYGGTGLGFNLRAAGGMNERADLGK